MISPAMWRQIGQTPEQQQKAKKQECRRMLRSMYGVQKRNKIRDTHIRGATKVTQVANKKELR